MTRLPWDKILKGPGSFLDLTTKNAEKLLADVEMIAGKLPQTAIDIGSGQGFDSIELAKLIPTVKGIEPSSNGVSAARENAERASGYLANRPTFICASAEEALSTMHESADLILCKFVIAHIEDKERFLDRISHIMGPNSVLVLMTPVIGRRKDRIKRELYISVFKDELELILNSRFELHTNGDNSIFRQYGVSKTYLCTLLS